MGPPDQSNVPSKPEKPAGLASDAPISGRSRRLLGLFGAVVVIWLGAMAWVWFEWRSGAAQQAQLEGLSIAGEALTWSGRVQGIRLTEAGDNDIDQLAELELPDLRQLQLTDCSITLKGLQTVASLGPLVELNLRGTPLPKEAVDVLLRIFTLEKLDVTRCGLPLEGVQRLEREIPGLRIAS